MYVSNSGYSLSILTILLQYKAPTNSIRKLTICIDNAGPLRGTNILTNGPFYSKALRKMKNQETPGHVKVLNPRCLMPPESERLRTHAPMISQKSADLCHQIIQNRGCKQLRQLR